MRNPIHTMELKRVADVVLTCCILHNMRIEEYVSGQEKYKPDDNIDMVPIDAAHAANDDEQVVQVYINLENDLNILVQQYAEKWNALANPVEHKRLQDAIVDLIYEIQSEYFRNRY